MRDVLLRRDAGVGAAVATHTVLVLPGNASVPRLLALAAASAPDDRVADIHALLPGIEAVMRVTGEQDVIGEPGARHGAGRVSTVLRALHSVQADALVIGYPDHAAGRSHFTDVVERATAAASLDVVVCVERHERPWQRILMPYLYGPLDAAALVLARRLARQSGAAVTVLHVEEPNEKSEDAATLRLSTADCKLKVVRAFDPVEAAADEARLGYDVVVLGARDPRLTRGRYFTLRQQRLLLATDASLVIVHPGRQAR